MLTTVFKAVGWLCSFLPLTKSISYLTSKNGPRTYVLLLKMKLYAYLPNLLSRLDWLSNCFQDLSTRHSAALSVKAFVYRLTMLSERPKMDEIFLDIYLLLYDMLNDDDEELRDVAAVTASLLLSGPGSRQTQTLALLPTAASFHMTEFLIENYASSPQILRESIRRFLGARPSDSALIEVDMFVPVSTLLFGYPKGSSLLFAEEKQNLFIDHAKEARIW